jgi:putative transposase
LIAGLRQHHRLDDLLRIASLARSTFYYHQRQLTEWAASQSDLQAKIQTVYDQHKGRYGYRRITAALRSSTGKPINHKCVQRLMQTMGLRALIRVKKRAQRSAGLIDEQVPNVLARNFSATTPDQKWATDITEFNVAGQKLYLSACMDLYNGEIIAYRMARRPVYELVCGTLRAALSQLKSLNRLTVHSDQGWHYKMKPYRAMLARQGVTQSMSRKGNCFDNAVIESFFGTLKAEYLHLAKPSSIEVLEAGVHDYIRYYNHERIRHGLQWLSPVEYRLKNTACSAAP